MPAVFVLPGSHFAPNHNIHVAALLVLIDLSALALSVDFVGFKERWILNLFMDYNPEMNQWDVRDLGKRVSGQSADLDHR